MTAGKDSRTGKNFEASLEEIERIVAEIEGGELPLDRMVPKFKQAAELISRCRSMLAKVEQQIKVVEDKYMDEDSGGDGDEDR